MSAAAQASSVDQKSPAVPSAVELKLSLDVFRSPPAAVLTLFDLVRQRQINAIEPARRPALTDNYLLCADLINRAFEIADRPLSDSDNTRVNQIGLLSQALILLRQTLTTSYKVLPSKDVGPLYGPSEYGNVSDSDSFVKCVLTTRSLSTTYYKDPTASVLVDRPLSVQLSDSAVAQAEKVHHLASLAFPPVAFPHAGRKKDIWNNSFAEVLRDYPEALALSRQIEKASDDLDPSGFGCFAAMIQTLTAKGTPSKSVYSLLTAEQLRTVETSEIELGKLMKAPVLAPLQAIRRAKHTEQRKFHPRREMWRAADEDIHVVPPVFSDVKRTDVKSYDTVKAAVQQLFKRYVGQILNDEVNYDTGLDAGLISISSVEQRVRALIKMLSVISNEKKVREKNPDVVGKDTLSPFPVKELVRIEEITEKAKERLSLFLVSEMPISELAPTIEPTAAVAAVASGVPSGVKTPLKVEQTASDLAGKDIRSIVKSMPAMLPTGLDAETKKKIRVDASDEKNLAVGDGSHHHVFPRFIRSALSTGAPSGTVKISDIISDEPWFDAVFVQRLISTRERTANVRNGVAGTTAAAAGPSVPAPRVVREISDIERHLKFAAPGFQDPELVEDAVRTLIDDSEPQRKKIQDVMTGIDLAIRSERESIEAKERAIHSLDKKQLFFEAARIREAVSFLRELSRQIKANGFPTCAIGAPRSAFHEARLVTSIPFFNYFPKTSRRMRNWWKDLAHTSTTKNFYAQEVANFVHQLLTHAEELLRVPAVPISRLIKGGYVSLVVFIACFNGRAWAANPIFQHATCPDRWAVLQPVHVANEVKHLNSLAMRCCMRNVIMDTVVRHLAFDSFAMNGVDASFRSYAKTQVIDKVLLQLTLASWYQRGVALPLENRTNERKQLFQIPICHPVGVSAQSDASRAVLGGLLAGASILRAGECIYARELIEDVMHKQVRHSIAISARCYAFVEEIAGHLRRASLNDVMKRFARLASDAKGASDLTLGWSTEDDVRGRVDVSVKRMKVNLDEYSKEIYAAEQTGAEYMTDPSTRPWYDTLSDNGSIIIYSHSLPHLFSDFFKSLLADCHQWQRGRTKRSPQEQFKTTNVVLLRYCVSLARTILAVLDMLIGDVSIPLSGNVWTKKRGVTIDESDIKTCHNSYMEGNHARAIGRLVRIIAKCDNVTTKDKAQLSAQIMLGSRAMNTFVVSKNGDDETLAIVAREQKALDLRLREVLSRTFHSNGFFENALAIPKL
jgi:hypothetical protein